jgi:hypothetical protein
VRVARTITAVVLVAVFALVAIGNSLGTLIALRRKRAERAPGGVSMVPVIGGVAGALACLVAPVVGLARWAWLPLVLDVGCAPLLALTVVAVRRK